MTETKEEGGEGSVSRIIWWVDDDSRCDTCKKVPTVAKVDDGKTRKGYCRACFEGLFEKMHYDAILNREEVEELREEMESLRRQVAFEAGYRDKAFQMLAAREREIERIRSNFYSQRVDAATCHPQPTPEPPPGAIVEEYKGVGRLAENCAYAYWDDDDINDDYSPHISGPYCGCEKASAPYGGGAATCDGPCDFWSLRGPRDHRELEASDEDYERRVR